jgi:bifunctional non-homologous end joining protein LigD
MPKSRKTASNKSDGAKDRQLAKYREKRDFTLTAEPDGIRAKGKAATKKDALPFVIQKHAATRLHYDFRLAWNGVLKSWAVAKGPSYFPGDKRLAVQVEDHPLEYGGFEGIIPKGQYGGGTVMVWDRGTWEPHGDPDEGLRKGNLKFALYGEKLRGNWVLVRMGSKDTRAAKPNWLLIKEHDKAERGPNDTPITDEAPDSVLSGRDLDAIASAKDKVWNSDGPSSAHGALPQSAKMPRRPAKPSGSNAAARRSLSVSVAGTPKEALPSFIPPQLASLAKSSPSGGRWIHELKLDGYRIQARVQPGHKPPAQLLTRTGLDWTVRMNSIAKAVAQLPVHSALFDGEVVVLSPDGTTSFAELQAAFQGNANRPLTYFVFDLLHLDGHNLRGLPLFERKQLLAELFAAHPAEEALRLSEHTVSDGAAVFAAACKLGAEGIISKLADARYSSGRSNGWLKLKCYREQEFVIGGFTLPSNGIRGVGALLLGYYKGGKLIYAGRTGTGFTQKTHRMMRDRLEKLSIETPSFDGLPAAAGRGAHWVNPELVAQVSFAAWTADNLVRQAAFKGLREDKPAKAVRREEENESMPEPKKKNGSAPALRAARTARNAPVSGASPAVSPAPLPIRLTHPNKVLDVTSGVTKDDLAHYYLEIGPYMLPFIQDRPLTLVRCLNGSNKPCFYQKHANDTLPSDIGRVEVVDKKTGKPESYITLSTPLALVELAQLGVIEIHPWGSRNESLEKPDRVVIDLDPDEEIDWKTLAAAAHEVRHRMKSFGLESFLKTTGGKGLHVVAPIRPEHAWPAVKEFAHNLVLAMEKDNPSLFLTRMTKAARKGKIYLDYLRNDRGATAVAPYSPRARAGMPVAMVLNWAELRSKERPRFLISDFSKWKKRLNDDPWRGMIELNQQIRLPSLA